MTAGLEVRLRGRFLIVHAFDFSLVLLRRFNKPEFYGVSLVGGRPFIAWVSLLVYLDANILVLKLCFRF